MVKQQSSISCLFPSTHIFDFDCKPILVAASNAFGGRIVWHSFLKNCMQKLFLRGRKRKRSGSNSGLTHDGKVGGHYLHYLLVYHLTVLTNMPECLTFLTKAENCF